MPLRSRKSFPWHVDVLSVVALRWGREAARHLRRQNIDY